MSNYINSNRFYDLAKERLAAITSEKENLLTRLTKMPEGSIRFIKRGERIQFYLRTDPKDKNGLYLRKSETKKIRSYLQKSYDEKTIKLLENEQLALEKLLQKVGDNPLKIQEFYSILPPKVKENITPIDMTDEDFANQWLAIPFEGKKIKEDFEIFKTNKGEYVRSKSELTIANALYKKQIPYKYECPLQLKNGNVIYPDFTVLNKHLRKIIYWEHRGMMDTQDYARNAVLRNKDYMKNHIFLGKNLIITEETSGHPLSTAEIDMVIKEYLI